MTSIITLKNHTSTNDHYIYTFSIRIFICFKPRMRKGGGVMRMAPTVMAFKKDK